MAAKLALVILAVVAVIIAVTALSFWYFNRESQREHERDLQQMEYTERMVSLADEESSIDSRLERDRDGGGNRGQNRGGE